MSTKDSNRHREYYVRNQQRIRDRCREYARKLRENQPQHTCPLTHCSRRPMSLLYKPLHEQSLRHQRAKTVQVVLSNSI